MVFSVVSFVFLGLGGRIFFVFFVVEWGRVSNFG